MKYIYYFAIISTLFISCQSKTPIEIKQIESQEVVKILPVLKTPLKDSVIIAFPTEFEIKINPSVRYMTWHYVSDGKTLWNDAFDYQIYNAASLSQFDIYKILSPKQIRILKKERKLFISKKAAIELLKKYKLNACTENLNFKETIKLTSYDKFKKENMEIINEFRKSNDSINFRVMKEDGSFYYVQKKINW